MINEQFVSFETSKMLKEKGFNESIVPSQALVMRWLREVYNIFIEASIFKDSSEDADGNVVDEWVFYSYDIYASLDGHLIYSFDDGQYDTYEEACEAAIKYCLENLI